MIILNLFLLLLLGYAYALIRDVKTGTQKRILPTSCQTVDKTVMYAISPQVVAAFPTWTTTTDPCTWTGITCDNNGYVQRIVSACTNYILNAVYVYTYIFVYMYV